MAFYSAFSDFVSWVFSLDLFRLCVAVIVCHGAWFIMSEIVRYMVRPFDDRFQNDDKFKGI